jgi:hypothetical protein
MSTTTTAEATPDKKTPTPAPPPGAPLAYSAGTAAAAPATGKGPLPLMVAVTGHRDPRPEDVPALEEKVRGILTDIAGRCPHTPLALLSPLAEGADRLVARVALSMGLDIVVPLPLPLDEYRRDFESEASRREFDDMLGRACAVVEVGLMPGVSAASLSDPAARGEQYALAGAYLVRHCQLLIALWNGGDKEKAGGTGQTVSFQTEGVPDPYRRVLSRIEAVSPLSYLDPPETGPVYHILTPRASDPTVVGEPLSLRTFFPETDEGREVEEDERGSTFDRMLRDMDAFNADVLALEADPARRPEIEKSAGYLIPDAEAAKLTPELRNLRRRYAAADVLAQGYQRGTYATLARLCALVFVGVFTFEVSGKLFPDSGFAALLFPLFVAAAWALYTATLRRGKWQDHHQDYRALAEGLRVAFFWQVAGLPAGAAADLYLREQRTELDWIRIALRNLSAEFVLGPATGETRVTAPSAEHHHRAASADGGDMAGLQLVRKHWVEDQHHYFHKAAHRDEGVLERIEKWVGALVLAGPVVAALMALAMLLPTPVAHFLHDHDGPGLYVHKGLIILVFTLAAIGGVLHTWVDKRALPQQVKQYERMGTLFAVASRHLTAFLGEGRPHQARRVILELGEATLSHNATWVLTHRERPVEVPHAG